MHQLIQWLTDNLGAGGPTGLLALVIFFAVYAARKLAPGLWTVVLKWVPSLGFDETPVLELLHKLVQSLPALVLSAVVSAIGSGGDVKKAVLLALAGPLAAIFHEVLKVLPVPYVGALGARKVPPMPTFMLAFMLVVPVGLFCSACGLFAPGKPLAPVAECAPTAEGLLAEVAKVLLSGDYEAELARQALMEGQTTVDCAVQEYLRQLKSGKVSASPERTTAREHAEAYLAKRRVK